MGLNISKIDFSNTKIAFQQFTNQKLNKTYIMFWMMNKFYLVKVGTFFIKKCLDIGFPIKKIIKSTIFEHFCGGESIENCQNTIDNLHKFNLGTILDYSVEGEENEVSFENTKNEIIKTIKLASKNPEKIPFSVFKITGVGSVEILEIPAANRTDKDKIAFEKIKNRVEEICLEAYTNNVKLFIDAEETWIQTSIDAITLEMMQKFNTNQTIVFNTYQFYLKKSHEVLENHIEIGRNNGFKIGAKLVRGAYLEKERKTAILKNYADPTQISKDETDEAFNSAVKLSIDNLSYVNFCLGTHNEDSCLLCIDLMEKKGLEVGTQSIYFAQLLGMSDNISFNLAANGFNVAKYVPYGPIEAVMPYLFRRANENTSIAGQSGREFLLIKKEIKRRNDEKL